MGTVRADTFTDEAGTGAPDFSNGMILSGGADTFDTYQTQDLTLDGTFTGSPGVRVTRIGNVVTMTSLTGSISHTSSGAPATSAGWLPTWARPTATAVDVMHSIASTHASHIRVQSDGTVLFAHYNQVSGASNNFQNVSQTSLLAGFCMSWCV